jgi:hypothetical protein
MIEVVRGRTEKGHVLDDAFDLERALAGDGTAIFSTGFDFALDLSFRFGGEEDEFPLVGGDGDDASAGVDGEVLTGLEDDAIKGWHGHRLLDESERGRMFIAEEQEDEVVGIQRQDDGVGGEDDGGVGIEDVGVLLQRGQEVGGVGVFFVAEGGGGSNVGVEVGLGRDMVKMTLMTDLFDVDEIVTDEDDVVEAGVTDASVEDPMNDGGADDGFGVEGDRGWWWWC